LGANLCADGESATIDCRRGHRQQSLSHRAPQLLGVAEVVNVVDVYRRQG
jgi:hypothetical protein